LQDKLNTQFARDVKGLIIKDIATKAAAKAPLKPAIKRGLRRRSQALATSST
jgi:hypothetical protein